MPNKSGVSMLSLVIIVVVTILLAMIATTAGFRYIEEANKVRAASLKAIVGSAAYQRQNDLSAGVANRYYDGYSFNIELLKDINTYKDVKGLPSLNFDSFSGDFANLFNKENSNWYVIDAEAATDLGAKEAETFLTRNISSISSGGADEIKVILVDYTYGDSYYVTFPKNIAGNLIKKNADGTTGCNYSPNGQHKYTIVTCTDPAKCIYCNQEALDGAALGHSFIPATCTTAEYCERCGVTKGQPQGHQYITNLEISEYREKMKSKDLILFDSSLYNDESGYAWVTDATKHWHECKVCGNKIDETAHQKITIPNSQNNVVTPQYDTTTYHYETCIYCGWYSAAIKHTLTIDTVQNPLGESSSNIGKANAYDNQHRVHCTLCSYESIHNDTGWLVGNEMYHYRKCTDASSQACNTHKITLHNGRKEDSTNLISDEEVEAIFIEEHYDNNHDFICDVENCKRYIDKNPPLDFGVGVQTYARVKSVTTHSINLEAYTIDNESGIDYYIFGMFDVSSNSIKWQEENKITPATRLDVANFTFDGLKPISNYTLYVKAYDKNGNVNNAYQINATTADFPTFTNINNVPNGVVKGPALIGIDEITTDLPKDDIMLQYSTDNRNTWEFINLNNIKDARINIEESNVTLLFRFVDYGAVSDAQASNRNYSKEYSYYINVVDNIPLNVSISGKSDSGVLKSIHYATVILLQMK